jgi:cytochrome c oxidase assembly protein Cox11
VLDLLMLLMLGVAFAGVVLYVRACSSVTRPNGTKPGVTP